ncbi:MAG: hypothetical protein HYX67_14905 [Candidatus Melainabacteria bacterium]|nr:hypothetical protein [Candidatus Melainabacteria bacterium]
MTTLAIVCISSCLPVRAENEDVKEWESKVSAGKYTGLEKEIEAARQSALEKNDYVRVSAIEELQNEIKRRKGAAGGGKVDNATTLNEAVRMQMIMLQSMVEKFAKQHHGKYPIVLNEEFKGYFPMITINKSNSTAPFFNPFTKKQEWFAIKPLNSVEEASEEEALQKGQIMYCPVNHGSTYAIIAGAADGKLMRNKDGQNLIMSRK